MNWTWLAMAAALLLAACGKAPESRLAFRVGGKIVGRNVEVGARVREGQVLARLDPEDLALAVRPASGAAPILAGTP